MTTENDHGKRKTDNGERRLDISMGLLSGLLGHAAEADVADVEQNLAQILADDERVERAFQLVRDLLIFTNRRFILVDRQGITGRKTTYHSIPYRAITNFAVETAGHLDLESELKIWISSQPEPIQRTFTRGRTIFEVQKALAAYVGR
jgi:hypothetical protein